MRDFTKYINRIKDALNELEEKSYLLKKANYNKRIIEELENEIKVSKKRKIETLEILDQTIEELEKTIGKDNI